MGLGRRWEIIHSKFSSPSLPLRRFRYAHLRFDTFVAVIGIVGLVTVVHLFTLPSLMCVCDTFVMANNGRSWRGGKLNANFPLSPIGLYIILVLEKRGKFMSLLPFSCQYDRFNILQALIYYIGWKMQPLEVKKSLFEVSERDLVKFHIANRPFVFFEDPAYWEQRV